MVADSEDALPVVPWREALVVWCRVAVLSFGGPAGQIAVMQRILVEEKRWIGQQRFLHALNYCMLLPGPEAQQLAVYLAWLLNGTLAGVVAGTLFVIPGFLSILALSVVYTTWQGTGLVAGLFYGLKPAVLAVVLQAVVRIGRRALSSRERQAIAALAFVAIFFLDVPFPLIVVGAAALGWALGWRRRAAAAGPATGRSASAATAGPAAVGEVVPAAGAASSTASRLPAPSWRHSLAVVALWLPLWWAPVAIAWALLGRDSILVREGLFFGRVAALSFGGAYAALAYVAQQAVDELHWVSAGEMLDGLGMAETTPGPLIQVVQLVGFLAAHRDPGALSPLVAALLGSLLTAWVVFAPSFLWIFLGAPWIERLRGRRGLDDALSAITAAVVGVVLNLAVWFALHTLFGRVDEGRVGLLRLWLPQWGTLDPIALALAAGAAWLLLRRGLGMLTVLALAVAAGALCYALWVA